MAKTPKASTDPIESPVDQVRERLTETSKKAKKAKKERTAGDAGREKAAAASAGEGGPGTKKARRDAQAPGSTKDATGGGRPKVVDPEDVREHDGDAVFGDVDFTFSETLRAERGFRLTELDPRSTPGYDGTKKSAVLDLAEGQAELSDLQERLFANGKDGDGPSVLLIVQGMDTSGKGGIMRHVVGSTDPGGVKYTAFKAPTSEERAHDFLWRIEKALPAAGQIGVFDRSQYEDVLVVRVHDLVPRAEWMRRYAQINAFERAVMARGTTVVKVMLHISSDEQRERLAERLARPDKYYKYNPGDIDERALWDDYMEAYQAVLAKTSTKAAPWHVVPADRKWYARLAVQQILLEHLRGLELEWPEATFDVAEERARLADS